MMQSTVCNNTASCLAFFQLPDPLIHRGFTDIYCHDCGGNGVMLIEYKPGSFEVKPGAKMRLLRPVKMSPF